MELDPRAGRLACGHVKNRVRMLFESQINSEPSIRSNGSVSKTKTWDTAMIWLLVGGRMLTDELAGSGREAVS